jgi:hypothetical protein
MYLLYMIGIFYLDFVIFIVLALALITAIPLNMNEKWEQGLFFTTFSEYILFSKWQLLVFLVVVVIGISVQNLIINGIFINTFWEHTGLWSLIHYSSLLVIFFSVSAISGILAHYKLPGKISYYFLTIIFFSLVILFL